MNVNRGTASPIDDAGFVGRLQDLDLDLDSDVVEALPQPTGPGDAADADRVDASIWLAPREVEKVSAPFEPLMFDLQKQTGLSDRLQFLIGPAAFVLLMLVGASAAALVFHERVAQLL